MLALIAAATMTLATAPGETSRVVQPMAPLFPLAARRFSPGALTARMHCKDAVRLQTGFEPALLYREQDRANARARRLIDLPEGAMCLVGEGKGVPPGGGR